MNEPWGMPLSVSLMPDGWNDPEVPNSEVVNVTELEGGDTLVVWSDWNTPRNVKLKKIELHEHVVVLHRDRKTIPEIVSNDTRAMRKKRRK